MAKEIIDIYVEQGYPYSFDLDFNLYDGTDLENDYTCTFYNKNIGYKNFTNTGGYFSLVLTFEDTGKIVNNLENYVVYVTKISNSNKSKLLSGRIHLDKKVVE